jgi:spoIIIJ-associated protein
MKIITKEGKSIQDTINQFKKEYDLDETDFSYDIIQDSTKGFLGLGRRKAILNFKYNDLSELIKDYLKEFVLYPQITIGHIDIFKDEKYIYVHLHEVTETGFMIGKDGMFLDNLQHVLNQTFQSKDVRGRTIILDVEYYKEKQERHKIVKIQKIAREVIKTKKNITLDPMTKSDRRIVHKAIQDMKDIRTMTIGEEPMRKIVLCLNTLQNRQTIKIENRSMK